MNEIKLKNYKKLIYSTRFSLEIESEFPEKVDIAKLKDRYKKLLASWTVVDDHSMVNGLEFRPKNKNKLYFKKESFDEISEVLHIIRKHKGNPDSKQCGLHIHINAKCLSESEIIKIVKEMIARQEFIVRDFNVRKDRLDQYCRFIRAKDIKGLTEENLKLFRNGKELEEDVKILNDKYFLLNLVALREHGTLEFRLFNGTNKLREIKKIVTYLFNFLINALERK
jgi:hypothetical protein